MTDHIQQVSTRPIPAPASGHLQSLGLERNPFAGGGPLITDPARRDTLAELRGWIEFVTTDPARPDRLAVLTAEAGMGKSSLLRQVAASTFEGVNVPLIDPGKGGLTDVQLLRAIVDAFGGTATGRTGMDLRRDIRHALSDLPEGIVPGLLIDDADYSGSRLELLRNVLRDGTGRGLFIILTGKPDLADRLARRRSFRAILGPVVQLGPMDAASLREIISSRIDALRRARTLFSQEASNEVVERAAGNPGRLLRLAEMSIEVAARQGDDRVERSAIIMAMEQMDRSPESASDTDAASSRTRSAVQAEIPLFATGGGGAGRPSVTSTQRALWDGGSGDDQVPD